MSDYGQSPLSGQDLIYASVSEYGFRQFVGEPGGTWGTSLNFDLDPNFAQSRRLVVHAPYQIGALDLTPTEFEKLKALALGKTFQARLRKQMFPLFVSVSELGELQDGSKPTPASYRPIAVEDLWREAQKLTVRDKAIETLRNLADIEPHLGFAHYLALDLGSTDGDAPEPDQRAKSGSSIKSLIGLSYGAISGERTFLFRCLADEGLISLENEVTYSGGSPATLQNKRGRVVRITPKGYALLERVRSGDPSLTRKAFMICRFTKELDPTFDSVYKVVGGLSDVACPILRVKDIPHVDQVTDRILLEIKEATVIVVDLTDTKKNGFNVAFEAGIALALNKPIVWTMRSPLPKKLPFDIQNHNILPYDLAKVDEFKANLKYRLLAALNKAKGDPY